MHEAIQLTVPEATRSSRRRPARRLPRRLVRASRAAALAVVVVGAAGASPVAGAGGACFPPPVEATVAVAYREPACRYCAGHRGIDFDSRPGDSVRAVAAGEVTFAGSVAGTRYVVVAQADGLRATYGGVTADTRS